MGLIEEKKIFYTENGADILWDEELEAGKAAYEALQEKLKLRQAVLEQIALVPDFYVELLHIILLSLNTQIQQNGLDKEKIVASMRNLLKTEAKQV